MTSRHIVVVDELNQWVMWMIEYWNAMTWKKGMHIICVCICLWVTCAVCSGVVMLQQSGHCWNGVWCVTSLQTRPFPSVDKSMHINFYSKIIIYGIFVWIEHCSIQKNIILLGMLIKAEFEELAYIPEITGRYSRRQLIAGRSWNMFNWIGLYERWNERSYWVLRQISTAIDIDGVKKMIGDWFPVQM